MKFDWIEILRLKNTIQQILLPLIFFCKYGVIFENQGGACWKISIRNHISRVIL